MADPTDEFFAGLRRRGYDPFVALVDGSVRFDISRNSETDHWLVVLRAGRVEVVEKATGGDAVIQVDRATFNRIVSGRAYFLTTVLRGEASVTGSPSLFSLVRRLFPAAPESVARTPQADRGRAR
ncbi:MAG TPA: sterol-binding protein [Micromonospora sp.]